MWTRTTLQYTTDCDKSIQDAYDVLTNMMTVTDDNENYNRAVWIAAISLGGVQLIYMVINTVIFCSPRCRRKLCCKVHTIIYHGIFLFMAIAILSLTAINFGRLYPKATSLQNWRGYHDCVDEYMQITSYQVSKINMANNAVISQLSIALVIAAAHLFNLFVAICLCCKRDRAMPR